MTFWIRSFVVLCFSVSACVNAFAQTQFHPYKAYLSTLEDDDDVMTVFSDPTKNWKNCTKLPDGSCKEAMGWPGRDADITVIGPDEKFKVHDPFTDKDVNETFVKVKFKYTREVTGSNGQITEYKKEGEGYIPKYALTSTKQAAIYANTTKKTTPAAAKDCPPTHNDEGKKSAQNGNDIARMAKGQSVVSAADEISKVVGKCLVSPPTSRPSNLPNSNVFDAWVVPKIKAQPVPKLKNEQNKAMTQADLINIDALARTLYGEMGGCFKRGLQYPMAVARVALNRLDNEAKWQEFTGTNVTRTNQPIPKLAKLLTTPEKFNNWTGRTNNGPLHQSLCPPTQAGKPFWNENSASKEEAAIWKNAVRIATEAVLYPNQFKSRSPGMKNVHFYTSGMGSYSNSKRVHASVDGRSLANSDCVELWTDPKPKKK